MSLGRALLLELLDQLERDPALGARWRRVLGLDGAEDLFGAREAGAVMKCSGRHVLDLVKRGELPGVKAGNRVLVKRGDVAAYLAARPVAAETPAAQAEHTIAAGVDEQIAAMVEAAGYGE